MAKLSNTLFAQWLIKQWNDGCGYLMGAVGQSTKDLTADSWLVSQYEDNPTQYEEAVKWLKKAPRVFDCQGLADCYVSEQLGAKTNVYARNNYADWCSVKGTGTIPAKRRTPGAAVFVYSSTAGMIIHVGFLVEPVTAGKPEGDWYVIEARGLAYGVVRTKLESRTWNRWGLMDKYFDYGEGNSDAAMIEYALGERTLKKGMSGSDVQALQMALMSEGFALPKYGADGEYGSETMDAVKAFQQANKLTADGIYGPNTHAALMSDTDDPQSEKSEAVGDKYTVTGGSVYLWDGNPYCGGTRTTTVVHKGDALSRVGEYRYVPVEYNGAIRWINDKYLG